MARGKIGIGTVSLVWMGQLHTRAYRRLFDHYPGCELEPRRYDDLKVSEAERLLSSVADGRQRAPSIHDIVSTMRAMDAMGRSCETGRWEKTGGPARAPASKAPDPRAVTGERRMGGDE